MNRIHNILVIVDPTATAQHAVAKGALLAQKFGARLELFICDTKAAREARLSAHNREQPGRPLTWNVNSMLEELAAPLRARGLDVAVEAECVEPLHVGLAARTQRASADLVVKDTHHHSLLQRTLMTNTDWNLIRTCPAPLLLVKEKPWSARPRIMAAVDPGHANDKPIALDHRILECASLLSRTLGGELHAVHAYVPAAVIAAAAAGGMPPLAISVSPEEMKREEADKRKQVEELAGRYGAPSSNVHLELGGPGELLPRVARAVEADVMTMGAISRSGLKRAFLGATAEDVLERLPCDALIVKPPEFAEAMSF